MIPPPSCLNPWVQDKVRAPWRTHEGFLCLPASQTHQAFSHFLEFSRMAPPTPALSPASRPCFACAVAFAWNALLSSASADYSLDLSSSRLPSLHPALCLYLPPDSDLLGRSG